MTITAADVMADADNGEYDVVTLAENMVDALLAQVPPGCDVVILADGTLARLEAHDGWEAFIADDGDPALRVRDDLYRLVPLTGEP